MNYNFFFHIESYFIYENYIDNGSKVYLVGTKLCSLKTYCVDGLASHSFSFAGIT